MVHYFRREDDFLNIVHTLSGLSVNKNMKFVNAKGFTFFASITTVCSEKISRSLKLFGLWSPPDVPKNVVI